MDSMFRICLKLFLLCFVVNSASSDCHGNSHALKLYNGKFRVNKLVSYGKNKVVVAMCNKGYDLFGDRILICDGTNWIVRRGKTKPTCREKKCPEPPAIENGFVYYRKGQIARRGGTRVFYKCLDGFQISSSRPSLFCLKRNKRWRGTPPKCISKKKCPELGDVANGRRTPSNFEEGSVVQYECNQDSTMIGPSVIKCRSDATWNDTIPECKPQNACKLPTQDEIPHSRMLSDVPGAKYVLADEFVTMVCEKGFRIEGMNFLQCLQGGTWDSDFAKCSVVHGCPPAYPIANGGIIESLKVGVNVSHGTTLNYFCNETYRMVGSSWIECVDHEFEGLAWSNKPPKCFPIRCSDHEAPDNGVILSNGPYYVGDVVSYSCYEGYKLVGSKNRTCKDTGTWSGALATCDSENTVCPNPGVPINGMKSGNRYDAGDVVVFSCKPTYFLFGNATRICQSNGYWSGTEVFCRGTNEFDDITHISNKLLTRFDMLKLISKKSYTNSDATNNTQSNSSAQGRTLNINNPGGLNLIFIFDSSGSVGKRGFETAKKFASTLVQHIGVGANGVRVAAMTFSSDVTVNFYTREFLTTEEVVEQIGLIQYNPGDTATNPALITATTEVIPEAARARPLSSSAVFLITDGRANVGGRPKEAADRLIQEFDVEIYAIGVGSNILEDELASIAYSKDGDTDRHYMKVESFAKMNEMLQLLINGTIDYSACGLLQRRKNTEKKELGVEKAEPGARNKRSLRIRIVGGETVTKHWPWMVGLYYGSPLLGHKSLQCGGSLIAPNWILTAAHCIKLQISDDKIVTYTTRNVRIHLGITNIKNPDNNNLIIATPQEFVLHPQYDPATINNDVALIRLQEPVTYNPFIRPVCLPPALDKLPKNSLLYKTGETAIVTGWGHTKERKKHESLGPDDLKQSAILKKLSVPIQEGKVCNDSIQGEFRKGIYTDSMLCAGMGKKGQDACATDSGGPLHQRLEDSEGDGTYYTQIGIVSWGYGCALEGEYGFYTRLTKFIPWIEGVTNVKFSN
uniref:limulus clotting factor C n=1 Tax=Ammothea sp. RS-2014 TaxID=1569307 RepID=A0A0E4B9P4_9CHEL|nr:complement factor B-1 [Ammothea sp. RS-2014]